MSRIGFRRTIVVLGWLAAAAFAVTASSAAGALRMDRIEAAPRIPAGAQALGSLSGSTSVSGIVALKPRDPAVLTSFINQVTDKGSPLFHQYLPAGAFASRFGASEAAIAAVRAQLKADGLRVTDVAGDGLFVSFSGSAARVEAAFQTRLERYRLRDGSIGRGATSALAVPAKVAGSVAAVVGLDDLVRLQPAGVVRAPASDRGRIRGAETSSFTHPSGSPTPCSDATADAQSFGGLTDDQIANAYGAFGLYGRGDLGAGQRIALYELEPFLRSDVKTFDSCYFGASAAAGMLGRLNVIPVDGGQPTGPGSGEANLDVEDLSAIAPGATIDVYEGAIASADQDYDPVDPYVAMIDADRDQIISSSWGLCEQSIELGQPGLQAAENLLFEQAAAQGQTVFAAAGDNGDDDCNTNETSTAVAGQNPLSVDDPGSQPYVVSVGGTTITDASSQPPGEQIWNDGSTGGAGGGGISQSWTMPSWQRIATVPGIAFPGSADYRNANTVERSFGYPQNFCQSTLPDATQSTPCRLVPDVAAQADEFTGSITVYDASEGGWVTIGGTSSATPIWAATLALANSSPTCSAQSATQRGVGFANPLLYAVASNPSDYAASFNDVTTGNNDLYDLDNGLVFPATTGYDLASGLGSPRLTGPGGTAGLAYYLCSFAGQLRRPTVTALSPKSGSTAGGQQVTVTGSGFEAGGIPDVASIEVGAAQLAPKDFTVQSTNVITATVPPARDVRPPDAPAPQDGAGPADVIVTLYNDESSAPDPAATFEYVDKTPRRVPSVTGVVAYGGSESAPATVTILGSGFGHASAVTFGGVPAAQFTVLGPNEISATPPAFSSRTACAPLPATGVYAGENASNDICQVQVRVTNGHGTSATGRILPPLEGAITLNALGDLIAPAGCGCEIAQAPTEYDYAPQPKITSVSTSAGPSSYASESGGTVITADGVGLNPLTILWADFGPASLESSIDTSYVYLTGTQMQIASPSEPVTADPVKIPFSVKTLAGQSGTVGVTYAGGGS